MLVKRLSVYFKLFYLSEQHETGGGLRHRRRSKQFKSRYTICNRRLYDFENKYLLQPTVFFRACFSHHIMCVRRPVQNLIPVKAKKATTPPQEALFCHRLHSTILKLCMHMIELNFIYTYLFLQRGKKRTTLVSRF